MSISVFVQIVGNVMNKSTKNESIASNTAIIAVFQAVEHQMALLQLLLNSTLTPGGTEDLTVTWLQFSPSQLGQSSRAARTAVRLRDEPGSLTPEF